MFLLLILRDDKIETFLKISDIKNIVTLYGPIILGLFCSLSSTTHSAISLEGKNYWIMKTLPVSPYLIFASKIMVNLTILLPTILIASVLLLIYLKANCSFFCWFLLPDLFSQTAG